MTYRVGVDIGGTFIDFCVFDEATQELVTLKVLTTPGQPGAELIAGMERLEREHGVDPKAVTRFIHGTTVGVNTVIQRRGARLALFTTENFADVLEVARLRMPESYSLFSTRPPPLVPRDRVFGVAERMRADGSVATPLDEASVSAAVAAARDKGVEGILVSLLHGWRNPAHEQAVAAIVRREAPELFVFMSSDIWPVIREYERSTTTVINGYIHPRVSAYLGSLQDALAAKGVPAVPLVTKSNGGVMSAEAGKTACVNMVLSGTASGVMGGAFVAERCGLRDVITLDIGGTSADVAVIIDGAPQYGMGEKIGEFPLYVPSVSVTSIGDGGGSIAWVDAFGVLKVGPESAGSDPGPACYGQGGTEPTLTDAFAVCGFLGHHALAYGSVAMDVERARTAIGGLAERLGRDPVETAEAVIEVAVARMTGGALRHRHPRFRAAHLRRRGTDGRLLPRPRARHAPHRRAARARRDQRAGRADRRSQERLHPYRVPRRRRGRRGFRAGPLRRAGRRGAPLAARGAGPYRGPDAALRGGYALRRPILRDRRSVGLRLGRSG
jgi:N-methylhydantoinase A